MGVSLCIMSLEVGRYQAVSITGQDSGSVSIESCRQGDLPRVKCPVSAAGNENQAVQACWRAGETRLAKSDRIMQPPSLDATIPA